MDLSAVLHRPTPEYIYPRSRQALEVSLTTARGDMAAVNVLFWGRYETEASARRRVPMRAGLRDGLRDYFCASIEPGGIAAYVRYCFALVMLTIGGFNVFTSIKLITDGKPMHETEVILTWMYTKAFNSGEFGYAAALSFIVAVTLIFLAILQFKAMRSRDGS